MRRSFLGLCLVGMLQHKIQQIGLPRMDDERRGSALMNFIMSRQPFGATETKRLPGPCTSGYEQCNNTKILKETGESMPGRAGLWKKQMRRTQSESRPSASSNAADLGKKFLAAVRKQRTML